jgi:uncharacterized membrane protein YccC
MLISDRHIRAVAFVVRCSGAASVAFQAATTLGLPESVWAVMSALIVSQERLHETRSSFAGRVLGTLLGIALTSLVSAAASRVPVSIPAQMAAAIALAAVVAWMFPLLRAAMWTCPVIFLTVEPSKPMFMIAVHRGAEVILGAVVGWVFHWGTEAVVDAISSASQSLHDQRERCDRESPPATPQRPQAEE